MIDTIYLYVDGADLDDVDADLRAAFSGFSAHWDGPDITLVDERSPPDRDAGTEDLPDRHLGVNIGAGVLSAVELDRLLDFAAGLAERTGREFVLGLADRTTHRCEDVCWIDGHGASLERAHVRMVLTGQP